MDEYCHNFLRLGHDLPGPNYTLAIDGRVATPSLPHPLKQQDRLITWSTTASETYYAPFATEQAPGRTWRLYHIADGWTASETTSEPWSRFALFGTRSQISPEAFIKVAVQPGESFEWTRTFCFDRMTDRTSVPLLPLAAS